MTAIKPIAHMESDFSEKFGIPRQSNMVPELISYIVFEGEYRNPDALRGIEQYDYLWLVWEFSENINVDWTPTVRPPKLGGNVRKGVFATRSPFRPNPIGLSSVKLEQVIETTDKGKVIQVSGADLLNQTPIYDIKPYIPYCDSHPDAAGGFAMEHKNDKLDVKISEEYLQSFEPEKQKALLKVLELDPRPSYHTDEERIYGMTFAGREVKFQVKGNELHVVEVGSI